MNVLETRAHDLGGRTQNSLRKPRAAWRASAQLTTLILLGLLPMNACGSSGSDDANSSTATTADDDADQESTDTGAASDTNTSATDPSTAANDTDSQSTDDGEPPVGELPEDDTSDINFGGGADISVSIGEDPAEPNQSDDGQADDEPAMPLVSCSAAVGTGEAPVIDDFEDADEALLAQDGRDAGWYWYNSADDGEQGFVVEISDEFPSGGTHAMHTWGSAYEWAGIGAGLRWSAPDEDEVWRDCLYDASIYAGVRFWARGNGQPVRFSISVPGVIPVDDGGSCDDGCWDNHGINLVIDEEWQEYFIGFDDMLQSSETLGPLDPRELRTFQFEFPNGVDFDLWLDEIAFYSAGDAPSSTDDDPTGDDSTGDDQATNDSTGDDQATDDSSIGDSDAGVSDELAADGGQ